MVKICLVGASVLDAMLPWVKRIGTVVVVVDRDIDGVGGRSSRQRSTLLQSQVNRKTFTELPCQALVFQKRSLIGHDHRALTDVVQNQHLLLVHAFSASTNRSLSPPQTESDYRFGSLDAAATCSFAHLAVSCVALRSGSRGCRPHAGSGEMTAAAATDKYV